ncbi:MAG: hypothetical protein LUH05_07390 [Candidatus Gastranaerophilales bacterium]|nr:hypothetical protein [Candidatus Gastranaerophilales bacterium]
MADKENNQWEDTEYIDEENENQEYSDYNQQELDSEYEEDDTEDYDDYDQDTYEESPSSGKKKSPLIILLILLLLLGVIGALAVPKLMGNNGNSTVNNNESKLNNPGMEQQQNNSENLADSFFDAAGGENSDMMSVDFNDNGEINLSEGNENDSNVATISYAPDSEGDSSNSDLFENQEQSVSDDNQGNDAIMVVYNKATRQNPFKPPIEEKSKNDSFETLDDVQFEIIEPPTASTPDENLTRLLQTQISGILYDNESPSAIVNLNGIDRFVKVGDVVSGYKIVSITNDKVQISYKNNSYVAAIGELFTRGSLEKQAAIVNMENKFAGRYKNNN